MNARLLVMSGVVSMGVFLGAVVPAHASIVTFTLDCSISGLGTCTPDGVHGTITLTDDLVNTDWVHVDVNFTSPAGRLISRFFLNFDPAKLPLPSGYAFTATGATITTNPDSEGQGLYGMAFDININDNPDVNPFSTILKLQKASSPDINLNAIDFNFKDTTNNLLYAALNHNLDGPQRGALTSTVTAQVPEPGTLTLFGIGLCALAARKRRA